MLNLSRVPVSANLAMNEALMKAPRNVGDRFAGTYSQQNALAKRMRGMFYAVPKADDEWLTFDRAAVVQLADDLDNEGPRWSPGGEDRGLHRSI